MRGAKPEGNRRRKEGGEIEPTEEERRQDEATRPLQPLLASTHSPCPSPSISHCSGSLPVQGGAPAMALGPLGGFQASLPILKPPPGV